MAEASGSSDDEVDSGSEAADGDATGGRQQSATATAAVGEGSDDGSLGEEEGSLGGYDSDGQPAACMAGCVMDWTAVRFFEPEMPPLDGQAAYEARKAT